MLITSVIHPFLMASVPLATATLLAGVSRRAQTVAKLEGQLDANMQHRLCALADAANWNRTGDEYAWRVLSEVGGRRQLLKQARILFALMVERSKESGDTAAVQQMEANLRQIAGLLRLNWRFVLMPELHAHLCVDLFTDMCAMWEQVEVESC